MAEFILYTNAAHGRGGLLAQQTANSLAQAADHAVLFHRDDFVALAGSAQNDLFVTRTLMAS